MDNTENPNVADQTVANETTGERAERNKYKISILSDKKKDLSKINPKMVGADIRVYRPGLSKEARRNDRTGNGLHGPTRDLPNQG